MNAFKNLKPSVCFDAVFENRSTEEAIRLVSDCGYSAFEFWCWWEKDIDEINRLRKELKLTVASCCTKFISLTNPSLRGEYIEGLKESIEAAKRLDCQTLISQVGDCVEDCSRDEQRASIVDGLKEAAPLLETADITLVIEPLNEKVDHPGYYLVRSDEAFDIVNSVGSPNVKVVFDIYHQQISEGNLIPNILANIDQIGHFHAAGQPGRNELTLGEINYPEVFRAINETSYRGYVGLEYWPKGDPVDGLKKLLNCF